VKKSRFDDSGLYQSGLAKVFNLNYDCTQSVEFFEFFPESHFFTSFFAAKPENYRENSLVPIFREFFFGVVMTHTASPPTTSRMHTSGVQ